MTYLLKSGLVLFIIWWVVFGLRVMKNFKALFGPHPDDPAETPGARSYGVAHICAIWVGGVILALYFLFL